jgi:anti-sigma factor RsiW
MHAVVMDSLEEYLSGTLKPADRQAVDAHLSLCQACREEVRGMQDVSQLFVSLKSEEICEPSPGFYAGVVRQVEKETAAPSFAGVFALDFAFARRLVFASLLVLAVLGSYLVSRETEYPAGPSPEAILAQEDAPAFSSAPAQDNMLVTLTAYEQR